MMYDIIIVILFITLLLSVLIVELYIIITVYYRTMKHIYVHITVLYSAFACGAINMVEPHFKVI